MEPEQAVRKGRRALDTPVALFVFNRPEHTRAMFQRVAAARPTQLLVVADGARPGKPGEHARCEEVRSIVTAVDWPCEVVTHFAERNLGCRTRLVSGLNWVFQQVEDAILVEDDVLPDPSFFPFCAAMLERYRDDPRIGMVTGFNIGSDLARPPHSYYFSELTHIWGWATWRRAWQSYDEEMTCWPEVRRGETFRRVFQQADARRYWTHVLDRFAEGMGPDTWDYQWMVTNLHHGRLAVAPGVNLVENIGFDEAGTNITHGRDVPAVKAGSMTFPLVHPPEVKPTPDLDAIDQRLSQWQRAALPVRAQRKLQRMLLQRGKRAA